MYSFLAPLHKRSPQLLFCPLKYRRVEKLSAVCDVSNPLVKNLGADFTTLANNPCPAVSRPTLSNRQHSDTNYNWQPVPKMDSHSGIHTPSTTRIEMINILVPLHHKSNMQHIYHNYSQNTKLRYEIPNKPLALILIPILVSCPWVFP
jgi:hypothetical protein